MRLASIALIVLAVAAIALALWTVGGPGQARAERRDQTRMNDLRNHASHLACLHRQGLGPAGKADACPQGEHRSDPLTGAPYRVDVVSDEVVRICAVFETRMTSMRWANRNDFDIETGCLTVRTREAARW
ncbi:MAG: hypothetical protein JJU15_04630 [Pararhodobacter sp.]|nr:hypothetical protein [Pararhodobacter sp.]